MGCDARVGRADCAPEIDHVQLEVSDGCDGGGGRGGDSRGLRAASRLVVTAWRGLRYLHVQTVVYSARWSSFGERRWNECAETWLNSNGPGMTGNDAARRCRQLRCLALSLRDQAQQTYWLRDVACWQAGIIGDPTDPGQAKQLWSLEDAASRPFRDKIPVHGFGSAAGAEGGRAAAGGTRERTSFYIE